MQMVDLSRGDRGSAGDDSVFSIPVCKNFEKTLCENFSYVGKYTERYDNKWNANKA